MVVKINGKVVSTGSSYDYRTAGSKSAAGSATTTATRDKQGNVTGTQTVTAEGKVTERNLQGKVVNQFNVGGLTGSRHVMQTSSDIEATVKYNAEVNKFNQQQKQQQAQLDKYAQQGTTVIFTDEGGKVIGKQDAGRGMSYATDTPFDFRNPKDFTGKTLSQEEGLKTGSYGDRGGMIEGETQKVTFTVGARTKTFDALAEFAKQDVNELSPWQRLDLKLGGNLPLGVSPEYAQWYKDVKFNMTDFSSIKPGETTFKSFFIISKSPDEKRARALIREDYIGKAVGITAAAGTAALVSPIAGARGIYYVGKHIGTSLGITAALTAAGVGIGTATNKMAENKFTVTQKEIWNDTQGRQDINEAIGNMRQAAVTRQKEIELYKRPQVESQQIIPAINVFGYNILPRIAVDEWIAEQGAIDYNRSGFVQSVQKNVFGFTEQGGRGGRAATMEASARQTLKEKGYTGGRLEEAVALTKQLEKANVLGTIAGTTVIVGGGSEIFGRASLRPAEKAYASVLATGDKAKAIAGKSALRTSIAKTLGIAGFAEGGALGLAPDITAQISGTGKVTLNTFKKGLLFSGGGAFSAATIGEPIAIRSISRTAAGRLSSNTLLAGAYATDYGEAIGDQLANIAYGINPIKYGKSFKVSTNTIFNSVAANTQNQNFDFTGIRKTKANEYVTIQKYTKKGKDFIPKMGKKGQSNMLPMNINNLIRAKSTLPVNIISSKNIVVPTDVPETSLGRLTPSTNARTLINIPLNPLAPINVNANLPTNLLTNLPTTISTNINTNINTNVNTNVNTNINVAVPTIGLPGIVPIGGGAGNYLMGYKGKKRATGYLPSVAANEKIYRKAFGRVRATSKTKVLTPFNLRL